MRSAQRRSAGYAMAEAKCPGCGKPVEVTGGWTIIACNVCMDDWAGIPQNERTRHGTVGVGGAWPPNQGEAKS